MVALYRMTGKTRMQPGAQPSTMGQLAAGKRDEDPAARISYGDGFSGFDLDYLLLDMKTPTVGQTQDVWGSIPAGVDVLTEVKLEEIRLRYIAGLYDYQDEDEEKWFKAGLGVQLGHKELSLDVRQDGTSNSQKIKPTDDVTPYIAFRLAGGRGPIGVTADFAYNDDWAIGTGDLEGRMFDLEIRASYYIEAQDLTLFGGYRRFDIPASGNEGPNRYDIDVTVDGYFFGFQFVF